MFELPAVDLPDLSTAGDDALVSAIEDWGRVEAAAAGSPTGERPDRWLTENRL